MSPTVITTGPGVIRPRAEGSGGVAVAARGRGTDRAGGRCEPVAALGRSDLGGTPVLSCARAAEEPVPVHSWLAVFFRCGTGKWAHVVDGGAGRDPPRPAGRRHRGHRSSAPRRHRRPHEGWAVERR